MKIPGTTGWAALGKLLQWEAAAALGEDLQLPPELAQAELSDKLLASPADGDAAHPTDESEIEPRSRIDTMQSSSFDPSIDERMTYTATLPSTNDLHAHLTEQDTSDEEDVDWVTINLTANATGDNTDLEMTQAAPAAIRDFREVNVLGRGGEVWANALMKAVWPYVARHIADTLRKVLSATLTASLRVCSVSLGDEGPSLSHTQIVKLTDGSLRMNTRLDWNANTDIVIDAGPGTGLVGVSAGINNLQVHGDLSVILGPPCASVPFFNAAQVFFPNKPATEIRLSGLGIIAETLPGVSQALRRAVEDGIASLVVLPNRVGLTLNRGLSPLSSARSRCPPPMGVLFLQAAGVKGLSQAQQSLLWCDETLQTKVRFRLAAAGAPGACFPLFCTTQQVVCEVLDQRDVSIASCTAALDMPPGDESLAGSCSSASSAASSSSSPACAPQAPQKLVPGKVNTLKLHPCGTVKVRVEWRRHRNGRYTDAALGTPPRAGTSSPQTPESGGERPGACVPEDGPAAAAQQEPVTLVALELAHMAIQPPPTETELLPLRIAATAGGRFLALSAPGKAAWTRGDQQARNDMLLGVIARMNDLCLDPSVVASVVGLPQTLVEEYYRLASAEVPEWLDRAKAEYELRSALENPFFNEVQYFLVPASQQAVTLELVATTPGGKDAKDAREALAVFSVKLAPEDMVVGPFHFTPVDPRIGGTACTLTGRIVRNSLPYFGP
ncbi:Synaptotagmin-2 [Diplonema papillatum]|nr:Synaptotagmin-2 [Diplonema papillatum]